jgi:hypothetical protein
LRFNYSATDATPVVGQTNLGGGVPVPTNLLVPGPYASVGLGLVLFGLPNSAPIAIRSFGAPRRSAQKQFNILDTFAWTHGRHALNFGADWRRLLPTFYRTAYENALVFTSLAAVQQGFADTQLTYAGQVAKPIFENLSLFAQDHWKATSRLTLDFGLRWEFNPVPGASNGKYSLAVDQIANLATMQLAPQGTPAYKTSYDRFAPRLGFAYEVVQSKAHTLVIRGGGGIFYDTGQSLAATGYGGYPFFVIGTSSSNVPLPLQASYYVPPSLNVPLTPPYGVLSGISDPHLTLPYTEQWSLSLDQQLSARNTLTVSYVGNVGRKLLFTENYNNIGAVNPNFTDVFLTNNSAASSYNALQVQDQGYVAPDLQLIASYTWAHARDSASTEGVLGIPATWGNSDNDVRQIFNLAMNYKIPAKQNGKTILRSLTAGWMLSNRFVALSGYPLTVYQSGYCSPLTGTCTSFTPNLVPGQPIYLHGVPNVPGGWQLNPNAFSPVPTDPNSGAPLQQGTLGRNFLHGPGLWSLNTSLERNFSLYDRLNLAFRIDAFNVFNHASLGAPDANLGDATFGQLTGQQVINGNTYGTGGARVLQLSLKLYF